MIPISSRMPIAHHLELAQQKPTRKQTALERIATALEYISEDLKALRDIAEEVNKPKKK